MLFGVWKLTAAPMNVFWWACTGLGLLILLRPDHVGNGSHDDDTDWYVDTDDDD